MDEFHIYAQPLHLMWDVSWQVCATPYPQWDGSRCWTITAILQWTATSLLSPHVLAATVSAIFLHLSTSIFALQHVAPSSHPSIPTAPPSLQPGFSIPQRKDNDGKSTEDDDHMTIHADDLKAMFTEFNSEIEQSSTWEPPKQMSAYLEKHLNKNLTEDEADAILEDYPMLW